MSETKFCRDCKHYVPKTVDASAAWLGITVALHSSCKSPRNKEAADMETGEYAPIGAPKTLREDPGHCGPTGTWFDEKSASEVALDFAKLQDRIEREMESHTRHVRLPQSEAKPSWWFWR